MATCYQCGRQIAPHERHRKRVKTGELLRRRFPTSKPSAVTTRYGMRMVCASCARAIDAEWRRHELIQYGELGIAFLLLLIALLAKLFA